MGGAAEEGMVSAVVAADARTTDGAPSDEDPIWPPDARCAAQWFRGEDRR